jgi:hypothetical protein
MTHQSDTLMSEEDFHPFIQPYVRLTQRNMQLFMQFAVSPEMVSVWIKNGHDVFNQAAHSGVSGKAGNESGKIAVQTQSTLSEFGKSEALAGFLQGLMQSQVQFFVDLAQTSMAALSQGPVKMMEQMQHAANSPMLLFPALDKHPRVSKHKDH